LCKKKEIFKRRLERDVRKKGWDVILRVRREM
jgi:hypothetical protein